MRLLLATAIVSATIYTGEGPPIDGGTVLIEGNRIAAVGQDVAVPSGARVIEAEGSIVTPGLIEPASRLGLVEVSAVEATVEGIVPGEDKIRAALRVTDSFNPVSVAIPVARGGGVTSAAVIPTGGLISGQSAWVDLVPDDPVRRSPLALHVRIGMVGKEPGPSSRAFLRLREVFDDAKLFRGNRGPYIADRLRKLSVSADDLDVLARALDRGLPVVFEVDRATDISTVLELAREYRLKPILLGAAEGWAVADEIVRSGAGVMIDPLQNMPSRFAALRSRSDNAQRLHAAGVRVAFTTRSVHQVHRLRQLAGNAVAEGLPYEVALEAITRVPADLYGVPDAGRLAPGALANVVIWNGDPLEVTTWPVRLFVRGEEVPLRSRQDELTERYLSR